LIGRLVQGHFLFFSGWIGRLVQAVHGVPSLDDVVCVPVTQLARSCVLACTHKLLGNT
jgi:hypothetical protein